jgi:hypothetical protein
MYKNARNTRTLARDTPRSRRKQSDPKLISSAEAERALAQNYVAVQAEFDRAEAAAKANKLSKSKAKAGADAVVKAKADAVAAARANERRERVANVGAERERKKGLTKPIAAANRKKLGAMRFEEPSRDKARRTIGKQASEQRVRVRRASPYAELKGLIQRGLIVLCPHCSGTKNVSRTCHVCHGAGLKRDRVPLWGYVSDRWGVVSREKVGYGAADVPCGCFDGSRMYPCSSCHELGWKTSSSRVLKEDRLRWLLERVEIEITFIDDE